MFECHSNMLLHRAALSYIGLQQHVGHDEAGTVRAVFVRFSLQGGQSFDWRLATIAGMEVAKLVPWNSLQN